MKILIVDANATFLFLALRCQAFSHEVRYWTPRTHTGKEYPVGKGLVKKVSELKGSMDWAELIILTDNAKYHEDFAPFFLRGYPIFGCNKKAAQLELDREVGQKAFEDEGIETVPFETFSSYRAAIAYVKSTMGRYVSKPWGGAADKGLSYVSKGPADMVYKLEKGLETEGDEATFMLQEFVPGIEMAVGGWFGPGGFNQMVCENWEEKAFMNGGVGGNTGEQGTTLRYTDSSKLFDTVLRPLEGHLHTLDYIGYCDVNVIIGEDGNAYPLEFTMRLGDPTFAIQQALHEGDPAEWMLGLIEGKDLLRVSKDVAVGVVMTHGEYPHSHSTEGLTEGCVGEPIYGIKPRNADSIHYFEVMEGKEPVAAKDSIINMDMPVTAGDYVLCCTGIGETVRAASKAAYRVVDSLWWPSNVMYRTDIGERLKQELPELITLGYIKDDLTY